MTVAADVTIDSCEVVRAQALDDPEGRLDTFEGRKAVREATQRLRRARFLGKSTPIIDPATGRQALVFVRCWKKTAWVVIASWDGSLAYRLPASYFDERDPFKVVPVDELPDGLRHVRWVRIGHLVKLVDQILDLPGFPGQSHFRRVVASSLAVDNGTPGLTNARR